jgi:hypothetical protein
MPTRSPAIDTLTNNVIATIPIGQAPQAVAYIANAVPAGDGTEGLQPLGVARQAAHLLLASVTGAKTAGREPTSVSLFDQGLSQVLQASVTGLEPMKSYVLALATRPDGGGPLQPLSTFMTNPAHPLPRSGSAALMWAQRTSSFPPERLPTAT